MKLRTHWFSWRWAGLAWLAAWGGAQAQLHQICYEGPYDNGAPTVVVGCRDDSGGSCKARAVNGVNPINPSGGYTWPATRNGTFSIFEGAPGVAADVEVEFTKGAVVQKRSCRTLVSSLRGGGAAAPGHYLTGFSTDASGLVMTGVWRAHFSGSGVDVFVPSDLREISGGIATVPGAFAHRSVPTGYVAGGWANRSSTDALVTPSDTVVYAVGLKIEGVRKWDTVLWPSKNVLRGLESLIELSEVTSAGVATATPEALVNLPNGSGRVALAGGFLAKTSTSLAPALFATVSAPSLPLHLLRCVLVSVPCTLPNASGWRSEAKDDVGAHQGSVTASLWHLPATLDIGGKVWEVRNRVVRMPSALSTSPAAQVFGLQSGYAVTAIGAEVHWRAFSASPAVASSRLVQFEPLAGGADAAVAARHGSMQTSAQVEAYAMGIKLVPKGTPPDLEERPSFFSLGDKYSPAQLCRMFGGLNGWVGCKDEEPRILGGMCAGFPELQKFGVCEKP